LHEMLHGVGFMLGGARPTFGVGMAGFMPVAYATSEDKLPLKKMLITAYLPFVVLSVLFIVCAVVLPQYNGIIAVCFLGNFTGAIGDIWIASKLWKYFKISDVLVNDTKIGIEIYSSSETAATLGRRSAEMVAKPNSFAKIWMISAAIIFAIQIIVPMMISWSDFKGDFRLGIEGLSLIDVRQAGGNIGFELNFLTPILIGLAVSCLYYGFKQTQQKQK
jgi:hypothetical protein